MRLHDYAESRCCPVGRTLNPRSYQMSPVLIRNTLNGAVFRPLLAGAEGQSLLGRATMSAGACARLRQRKVRCVLRHSAVCVRARGVGPCRPAHPLIGRRAATLCPRRTLLVKACVPRNHFRYIAYLS